MSDRDESPNTNSSPHVTGSIANRAESELPSNSRPDSAHVIDSDSDSVSDSASGWLRLDELCDRFEAAWLAGQQPNVEDYLGSVPDNHRGEAVRELLKLDVHYRRKSGSPPPMDEYRQRFPSLASVWLHEALKPEAGSPASPVGAASAEQPTGAGGGLPRVPGYEVLELIGRGGMGVVYKARDLHLRRLVALKMISAGAAAGPELLDRFRAEARAVASLQHPHLVQIHEVGEHEGRPYLVFEYMAGGSLDGRLHGVPQSPRSSAQLIRTVSHAIQFAHSRGFIHRDLKPANILLSGTAAAGESGVASGGAGKSAPTGKATRSSSVAPSPGANLGPNDRAASRSTRNVSDSSRDVDLPKVGDFGLAKDLESDEPQTRTGAILETICLKCLQKEPSRRYESAGALADDLDRFLRDEPVFARPVSSTERTWRWCRRHPLVAALALLLFVITAGGVGGIFFQWREAVAARALAEDNAKQARKQRDDARRLRREAESNLKQAEAAREHGERVVYLRNINAANAAIRTHHFTEAVALLQSCRTDLRDWEWHHQQRRLRLGAKTLAGLTMSATRVTVTPDGKTLVASSGTWVSTTQSELEFWEFPTGRHLETRRPHAASILDVAFHPQLPLLVTAGFNGYGRDVAKLTHAQTGQAVAEIADAANCYAATFSPDGRWLALAAPVGRVCLCDARTGQVERALTGHTASVFCLAFSTDSRLLASGSRDGSVRIWNATTGENVRTLSGVGDVRGVAFSPDGHFLAAVTFQGFLRLWDAEGATELGSYHTRHHGAQAMAFSPDAQWLAISAGEAGVQFWDPMSGAVVRGLPGHWRTTLSLGFSPHGRWLATAGEDGLVRILDLAVEPDGRRFNVQLSTITDFDLSPDGEVVATAAAERPIAPRDNDKIVRLWSVSQERELRRLVGHADWLTSVEFSPDGAYVASGSRDKTVRIWNAASGATLRTIAAHDVAVRTLAYSPDGRTIVSAGDDSQVKQWDATTGDLVRTLSAADGAVNRIVFLRNGECLIGAIDGSGIRVWPIEPSAEPFSLDGHQGSAKTLAVSSDNRWLASAGDDRRILLWDLAEVTRDRHAARPKREFETHDGHISSLDFSPNNRRLVSSSVEQGTTLWDVTTGVGVPLSGDVAAQIRFSRDGHRLVAAVGGFLSVWDDRLPDEPDEAEQRRRSIAWHVRESRAAELQGLPFAVLHHLQTLPADEFANDTLRLRRANAHAQWGNWAAAADDFEQLARDRVDGLSYVYNAAILRLRGGDHAAYRASCLRSRDELQPPYAPDAINTVAWMWCFAEQDPAALEPLREKLEEDLGKTQTRDGRLVRLNTLGSVLYRLGRWEDAVARLEESITLRGQGGLVEDWLFLAMSAQRLNHTDEARKRLDQARTAIEESRGTLKPTERRRYSGAWEIRVTQEMLLSEAERLIEPRDTSADAAPSK